MKDSLTVTAVSHVDPHERRRRLAQVYVLLLGLEERQSQNVGDDKTQAEETSVIEHPDSEQGKEN